MADTGATLTEPKADGAVSFCSYCSNINFDDLRVPTVGELRRMSAGLDDPEHYSYRLLRNSIIWDLGSIERILRSASACQFCSFVSGQFHDINRESPGRLAVDVVCEASINFWSFVRLANANENSICPRGLWLQWGPESSSDSDSPLVRGRSSKILQRHLLAFDPGNPTGMCSLFEGKAAPDSMLVFSGRIASEMVSTELLGQWVKKCCSEHEVCAIGKSKPQISSVFRLINVETKSIERFEDINIRSLEYVALSYVWGFAQRLIINRANKIELSLPGALVGRVARTIEDAMILTERLGFKYLWVDALCILQDNDSDKMVHLAFMGDIYEAAVATIIAASGTDAEAGLPGVGGARDVKQQFMKVREGSAITPPLHLVTSQSRRSVDSLSYLDRTFWETPGWTLQERVLSRRTLIFTTTEVYWTCRTSTWTEGIFTETDLAVTDMYRFLSGDGFLSGRTNFRPSAFNDETDIAWQQYSRLMGEYSRRNLTSAGDGYNAFGSIVQALFNATRSACLWAIPVTRFELGLCWTRGAIGEDSRPRLWRRTELTSLPMTTLSRKVPFPSWSPIRWIGGTSLRITDDYPEMGVSPEPVCYVLRNSPLRVVKVAMIKGTNTELSMPPRPKNFPQSPSAVTLESITNELPHLTLERLSKEPDDRLLFFWAEVAVLFLSGPVPRERKDNAVPLTFQYEICTAANGSQDRQVVGHTDLCVPGDKEDRACSSGEGAFEFVLLATNRPVIGGPPQKIILQTINIGGISYRVNIGDILEEAWEEAKPKTRLVVLG